MGPRCYGSESTHKDRPRDSPTQNLSGLREDLDWFSLVFREEPVFKQSLVRATSSIYDPCTLRKPLESPFESLRLPHCLRPNRVRRRVPTKVSDLTTSESVRPRQVTDGSLPDRPYPPTSPPHPRCHRVLFSSSKDF